jgi:eukaryotic-like serine/threonine-protein kinase
VFEPGTVVDGKYRIDRELGHGGMGVVVAATHLSLGTRVALKCMKERRDADAVGVERFFREARAAAQVQSEHICRVLDIGDHEGMPYIVMELLEGTDLGRVARSGPLDVATAADYVCQACVGLAKAHASQIVHRDLKPENLFLARRDDGPPIVKLLDFGIAKAPDRKALTDTKEVIGSPAYMSPEQILSSRNVDTRSDVWSLGVILYRLVAGRLPFTGKSVGELMMQICEQATPPIDGAPPELVAIIARCLDKVPANRFASVDELAQALRPLGTEVRDTTPYTATPPLPTAEHPTELCSPDNATTREELAATAVADTVLLMTPVADTATAVTTPRPAARPARRWPLALAVVAIAATGGVVGWWFVRDDEVVPQPAVVLPAPRPPPAAPSAPPAAAPTPAPAAPVSEPAATEPARPTGATLKHKHPGGKRPSTPPSDEELSRSRI